MANTLDSDHGGNNFSAGDSKALKQLVTDYFI